MFKFGFGEENEEPDKSEVSSPSEEELQWAEASQVFIDEGHHNTVFNTLHLINVFRCNSHDCLYINPQDAIAYSNDNCILEAETKHSDLIPAKYEGGFKIWECTQDLGNYIYDEMKHMFRSDINVLDLGCGAGLLGIFAMLKGCKVHFQDYNSSVLKLFTIPNVILNIRETERDIMLAKCKFFCGDWNSFRLLTNSMEKYDIILTSETIYNPQNYDKLHTLFKERLKMYGCIFLAAKTLYFGVGGGLRHFEKFLAEKKCFKSSVVWKSKHGVIREIMKLEFLNNEKGKTLDVLKK